LFYNNNTLNRTGRAGTDLTASDTLDITLGELLPDCCDNPPGTFTIIYDGNENTDGLAPIDELSPYAADSTVIIKDSNGITKTGFNFAGWNTMSDGSGSSFTVGSTFTITMNVILYAQWRTVKYTVSYYGNSNTGGLEPVDGSSPYNGGSMVIILNESTLVKTGYTFSGWNTLPDGSGVNYLAGQTFTINSDTAFYAQWVPIGSYTVIYYGNTNTGGVPLIDSLSPYLGGSTVTVLGAGTLVKAGHGFSGWNTVLNAMTVTQTIIPANGGISYVPGNTFIINSNTALYAQWTPITYTVTYNGNTNTGGSPLSDSSSPYLTGSLVTVLGSGTLVKTGNTFAGWNTLANGSGTSYAVGASFTISIDVILWAQWTPLRYTVTYNGNTNTTGVVLSDSSSPYVSGSLVTVLGQGTLGKTGNAFAGWNTLANGSGTGYLVGSTFTIGTNTVLYAQWTPITYTVTYNGNTNTGGSPLTDSASPYNSGAIVTVLGSGSLIKTGNNFAGWNTLANGSGTSYAVGVNFAILANMVFYAQWSPITFTVVYNGNTNSGGVPLTDSSSPYVSGSSVTVLGAGSLVKTGNAFTGWNALANGSGTSYPVGSTFTISTNVILYAQWSQITYSVVYDGNTNTGGIPLVDSLSPYNSGATVTVLGAGSLVKTGNNFLGWNTLANGSGTSYSSGSTFTIGSNTVLYAQWSPVTYTVAYNGNTNTGGSPVVDSSSPYLPGVLVTVLGAGSLVKTGNNFAGWNTLANGSGTSYAAGSTFTIGTSTVLYAQWTPITYSVAYNGNTNTGGSPLVDSSSPYNSGATVTVLGAGSLVKTGHTFSGWNTLANGSGTSYAAGSTFTIGANAVLYAQWTPSTYTVVYNGNTNTSGSALSDSSSPYAYGSTVTVLGKGTLDKTNNYFAGWNTVANGSGNSYNIGSTFTISENTTLYAQWATINCAVTYDGNTNTGGSAITDGSSPYAIGSLVTVLGAGSLVKTGYTFAGWNTLANGSGTAYAVGATFTIGTNTVLYAQWSLIVSYTVSYLGNTNTSGLPLTDSSSPYVSGSLVTVLGAGSLDKTGYTFGGWNTLANGSGTSYAVGSTFTISANTILYAQWTLIVTYTVSYDGNTNTGGSALTDGSSPYVSGSSVTVLGAGSLVKTGYTFTGWNTLANGSGTGYAIGANFTIGANTVLYAQWTLIVTYTVAYNGNTNTSGSPLTDSSSPYVTGSLVTVLGAGTLVKTGNNFAGWNTAANGSGTSYVVGATFNIGANTTLFAQWTPITYTVNYDGNTNTGGSALVDGSSPYATGSMVIVLGAGSLVKTGSNFAGWNTVANGSGTSYAIGASFAIGANMVLYAQWTPITYTVAYDGNTNTGGSALTDGSSPYVTGSLVTVLGAGTLTKTGNSFAGWNTLANGLGTSYAVGATFNIGANTILYAQWSLITYTVAYDGNTNTGGSALTDGSSPYATGSLVTVLGAGTLVKTGNSFSGWNTLANGSGTSYAVGATFTIGANVILYAQWMPIGGSYTITYSGNTNTGGNPVVDSLSPYASGSTVTVLGNIVSPRLSKTGYGFAGWNTAADGSGISYIGGNTFTISADTTLYAQWIFGVALIYNAGTGGSGLEPLSSRTSYVQYTNAGVVDNRAFVNGSLAFGGWNTLANGSGTSYAAGSTISMTGSIVLYAMWINPATQYTLVYNAGTNGSGTPPAGSTLYNSNTPVTVLGNTGPFTNSGGLTFYGWNTLADGTGTSYTPGTVFNIIANMTLYAYWVDLSSPLTVTYDGNGSTSGAVPAVAANYPSGVKVNILSKNTLTKPGFTFVGWNGAANGVGPVYIPGYTFTSQTVTLYAQWIAGSPVKNCGGGSTSGGSGGTAISYIFPFAQIFQSSDTVTFYTTALLGRTTTDYGTGSAPLGMIAVVSKTVLTSSTIVNNSYTSYINSANNYNYSKTITNITDVTYWPTGATITSITFPTINLPNSSSPINYNISIQNAFSGCGLSAVGGSSGGNYTVYNFFNQGCILNFSDSSNTIISNSPNSVFYTTNSGTTWTTIPRAIYPYALIAPAADNCITSIVVTPSAGSQYIYPPLPNYTVEYYGNGNTGGTPPGPQYMDPYISGTTSVALRTNSGSLAKTGFTFSGWNTAADGSGSNYAVSATYNTAANLRLYAKWV